MEGNRYPAPWIILFPVKLNCVDRSKRTAGYVEALDKLLYLADGEGRRPLGWSELTLTVQTQTVTLPCVILPLTVLLSLQWWT